MTQPQPSPREEQMGQNWEHLLWQCLEPGLREVSCVGMNLRKVLVRPFWYKSKGALKWD